MGHDSGGIGCGNVDWFTSIVNWVENGVEPMVFKGASANRYIPPEQGPFVAIRKLADGTA